MKWSVPILAAFSGFCGFGFWIVALLGYTTEDQTLFNRSYNGMLLLFGIGCAVGFSGMAFEKPRSGYGFAAALLCIVISVVQIVKMRHGWEPHQQTARVDLLWMGLLGFFQCWLLCKEAAKTRRSTETSPPS